jgi:hypothetical protein
MNARVSLGIDDDLRHSRPIAHIDKKQIAVVAPPVHPAQQYNGLARVRSA